MVGVSLVCLMNSKEGSESGAEEARGQCRGMGRIGRGAQFMLGSPRTWRFILGKMENIWKV